MARSPSTGRTRCSRRACSRMRARCATHRRVPPWRRRHDRRLHRALHLHARRIHGLRSHRAGARHPAYAAHVGLELRARHRAGRRHGRARARGDAGRAHHRLRRRRARRGQCRRRLRRHRADAGDVQGERRPETEGAGEVSLLTAGQADTLIQATYFAAALLFIVGLKRMSSPVTARRGIVWAGAGMLVATLVTFLWPDSQPANLPWIVAAIAIGGIAAWVSGKRVAMTNMPQMIALYNGMGGGAAAAIAAVELLAGKTHGPAALVLAVVGALIGC